MAGPHEQLPKDTWLHRSQRTSLRSALVAAGSRVARAEGPRHRHPRLRHRTRRRGAASAASDHEKLAHKWLPRYASLRSRPRAGQCSRQNGGAAGLPRALSGLPGDILAPRRLGKRARTAAAPCLTSLPPRGASWRHRRRYALPVPPRFCLPQIPLREGFVDRFAPGGKRLRLRRFLGPSPRRPEHPLARRTCLHRTWPRLRPGPLRPSFSLACLRNVLPEGCCVKARPAAAHHHAVTAADHHARARRRTR